MNTYTHTHKYTDSVETASLTERRYGIRVALVIDVVLPSSDGYQAAVI